jgi:hypothetical protein
VARVVVRDGRLLEGVDPAAVWTLVADPSRIGEWAGVRAVGYMGTELPAAGQVVFVAGRWVPARRARRVEILTWEAGHRYRCGLPDGRFASERRFEVVVTAEVEPGGTSARVTVGYQAEVVAWLASLWRMRAAGRLLRMLDRAERTLRS